MPRRALLIGIDNYLDENLALSAPRNDVTELARVLSHTGFSADAIECLIGSLGAALSANSLRKQIRDFFRSAEADDDLLLLISAHGIEQGEHRLVIPNDYYLEDPQPPSNLVGDHFLYGEAAKSRARSIIIIIDACREGVQFNLVEDKAIAAEVDRPSRTDVPTVAMVYSCAAGEKSRASGGVDGLSFFTAAWCAVLEADNEIATLADALLAVDAELRARLVANSLPPQAVTLCERPIVGRGGPPERLLIKENRAARTRQRIADSCWCQDVAGSPLWSNLRASWPAAAAQVQWIILCAEEAVRQAAHKLPEQRWRDERAPARTLRSLDILLPQQADVLSISEVAIALTLPFVYEGVLAAGELLMAKQGDALNLYANIQEGSSASRPWLAWQSNLSAEEAHGRRAAILQSQGLTVAAKDLIAWQLVRFLHASGELWEYSEKQAKYTVGWLSDHMHAWFASAPFDGVSTDIHVTRLLTGRRLVRLARLAFAAPEDIEIERGEGKDDPLQTELFIGPPVVERRVNELMLAHLLNFAFSLATDARRLSPLFAEHLGRPELITARFLQQTLHEITWHTHNDTLDAALDCPHEVIDLALADAIEQLNRHRLSLNQTAGIPETLLTYIPRFFGTSSVRARVGMDGKPLYRVPHLRLTLEHSRIREILMGEQLYGSSRLALRELYQNALDAIRYRRARIQYLRSIGKRVDDYVGRIEFRAGVEDGRRFIECRDNGIGMGERHVRNLFARAGSRFTDSHEFHLEKARWAEQGIKFWPNSRFGIGVFSYFMMADEIRVETKRLKDDGYDCEPGLILTVVGSGSLFRVQRGEGIAPGTTVRLYLNDPQQADQMTESVLEWLWLPEFETQLFDIDGTSLTLPAGQPSPTMMQGAGETLAVPESAGATGQPRLFWTLKQESTYSHHARSAQILVDGISTQLDRKHRLSCDGVVINVTEDLRVDLSVDRVRVKDLRAVRDWLANQVRNGAYRYLLQLPNIRLLDFEQAFMRKPLPLICLDRALRAVNSEISSHVAFNGQGDSLSLHGLGLSPTLDHLAFGSWLDSEKNSSRDSLVDSLRDNLMVSPLRGAVTRMVAARIRAVTEVAPDVVPWVWRRLAAFARQNEWQDGPSLGLLAGLSGGQPRPYVLREWALSAEEIAEIMDPLRSLLEQPEAEDQYDVARPRSDVSLQQFIANLQAPSPAHVALAAIRFRAPLQEILDEVRRVHGHAPGLANFQPDAAGLPASWAPFSLLSSFFLRRVSRVERVDNKPSFSNLGFDLSRFHEELPRRLDLHHLLFAAKKLNMSLQAVAELARPLLSWGVSVWDVSVLPRALLEDDAVPTWFEFNREGRFDLHVSLSVLNCAAIARASDTTAQVVAEYVQPLGPFGIHVPAAETVPTQPLSDLSWRLVTADLWEGPDLAEEFTGDDLAYASLVWGLPLDTLIEAARPLRAWGVVLPDLDALPRGLIPKKNLRELLLEDDELRPYSAALVVDAAERWGQSLDRILETLRPWIDLLFDKPLPPTPFAMDRCFKYLLVTQRDQLWTDELSAWDLAVTALKHENDPAEYLAALDQLCQFGIDVDEAKAFAQFCQNQS